MAFNPLNPRVDITDLLVPGSNTVTIEVSTPLGNFLRQVEVDRRIIHDSEVDCPFLRL
jgi:hypothetical protein